MKVIGLSISPYRGTNVVLLVLSHHGDVPERIRTGERENATATMPVYLNMPFRVKVAAVSLAVNRAHNSKRAWGGN